MTTTGTNRAGKFELLQTALEDVRLLVPKVHGDQRGFFMETYHRAELALAGIDAEFVQDNQSRSTRHVLRGLHYQLRHPQGKLVRAVRGAIFDVVVDLRRNSPSFGRWFGATLSEDNQHMLWVPAGLAHGFLVTSESADVLYKTTDYYHPEDEYTVRWNDADLRIAWPVAGTPMVSAKDENGMTFAEAPKFA